MTKNLACPKPNVTIECPDNTIGKFGPEIMEILRKIKKVKFSDEKTKVQCVQISF